jgi:hypothetical protein
MDEKTLNRIDHIFEFMEWEELTDNQLDFAGSLEMQWNNKGWLSDKQIEALEDMFRQAAERA